MIHSLQVGRAPAGQQDIKTAVDIHPSFGNIDRAAYYRRKLLVQGGSIPDKKMPGGADNFLLDLHHWAKCVKINEV